MAFLLLARNRAGFPAVASILRVSQRPLGVQCTPAIKSIVGRQRVTWSGPAAAAAITSTAATDSFEHLQHKRRHSNALQSQLPSQWPSLEWLKWIVLGVSAGLLGIYHFFNYHHSLSQAECSQESPDDTKRTQFKNYNFIADAVDKAAPSVVYIERVHTVSTIFGRLDVASAGSGFVVEDGTYVLTNAHVVSNATTVKVTLNSGQVVEGVVSDIDETTDLAIIKLSLPPGTVIPPLKFGNSGVVRPGEWVVAMGSPLSLTNTITCGIVSCLNRPGKELGEMFADMEYVQTDAAITQGNSGGPLVNLDGEVIGVNTMTAGPGISFAIPSNRAQRFVRSANKKAILQESSRRYMIGVSMLALTSRSLPMLRQYYSIPKEVTGGVLLTKVWSDRPAYLAGLMSGDVIVRINGQAVKSIKDVFNMVKTGKKMSIEYYRNLKYMTCVVVPEAI